MEEGWIALHRRIQKHWIYQDPEKYRAWTTILLEVNHSKQKVNIKNNLIEVERGESLNSLDTWAILFGKKWNKSKVRRFFTLLAEDSMIELIPAKKTTHLKVLNYDTYQLGRNANETKVKRKRNTNETQMTPNNNDKNDKNEKKKKKEMYRKVQHLSLSTEEFDKLRELGYSKRVIDDILDAMENYAKLRNYKSAYLTALKWLKKEHGTPERRVPVQHNFECVLVTCKKEWTGTMGEYHEYGGMCPQCREK